MDQNFLIAVMAAFVIISAIALCIQAGLLFGIYKSAKAIQDQTTSLMPQTKVDSGPGVQPPRDMPRCDGAGEATGNWSISESKPPTSSIRRSCRWLKID